MTVDAANVRPPAVAGFFYPADAAALRAEIAGYLAAVPPAAAEETDRPPKAIIVPHAGTVYSGPVAATAYARLAPFRDTITRVALFGPAHRVPVRTIAAPTATAFRTPLGDVAVDGEAIAALASRGLVELADVPHAQEHSLEVQLPFLQMVLGHFRLIPLVVGDATPAEVAAVMDALWDGPETLIVVSSDLSHFLDYDTAARHDAATCRSIEALDETAIGPHEACGCRPVGGLLRLARRHGLHPLTLDLRNSGDTAGPRDRVVGYGAWAFTEPVRKDLDEEDEQALLETATQSIRAGLQGGQVLEIDPAAHAPRLRRPGASFVTLKRRNDLRGCIGSLEPRRPLVQDVAHNAWNAAFADPRFPPLGPNELDDGLSLSISVLGKPEPIPAGSEAELLRQLRPRLDGLVLSDGNRRATFLPQVWETLPSPKEFLRQLKRKAGLPPDHWSDTIRIWRYGVRNFGGPLLID